MANNVPEIRFDSFGRVWDNRFLTDVALKRKIINSNMQEDNLLSLSYGKIKRKDIRSNKGLLPSSFSSYQIIDEDTIVFRFTDLQNDQKSLRVGLSHEKGIVSSAYVCVDPNKEIFIPDFFYWLLHYYDTQKVFYKMGDGIRQTITYEDLREMNLAFPSKEEQNLIANFVNNIDDNIIYQETECEKLRNLKSALLVSLFPQGNDKQPKLRLDGFYGDWEDKTLNEIVTPYKEIVATPHYGYERLGIRSHGKGTFHSFVPKGAELETAQMSVVRTDNLIVNITFGWELAVAITQSEDEGKLVSHRFPQFSFNQGYVPLFFRYGLINESLRKHLILASPGSAGRNRVLKIDKMLEYKMFVPSQEEQRAISDLLLEYDRLIQLNEQKLEKLRNLKQAMLNKMFV